MNCSDEIGGFFGLELPPAGRTPHDRAIRLNSGRNCLRYVIRAYNIKTIYLPYYTCPVVWDSAQAERCQVRPYSIDSHFMPIQEFPSEAFILYTNYFGVCSQNVATLARQYQNLIVDNAQAFYMPAAGLASFYSPRKFFGVPDGGLLYCARTLQERFPQGESHQRCAHLLKRLDLSAQAAYADYQANDEAIGLEPVQALSRLTERLLLSIDYDAARERRLANFTMLHSRLGGLNRLVFNLGQDDVPMNYPFLCDDPALRQRLLAQKIYVARYWPGMEAYCSPSALELNLREGIIPLPCDQRYSFDSIMTMCSVCTNEKIKNREIYEK